MRVWCHMCTVLTRVVDPASDLDSETLWIRIWIRIGNPDPDPGKKTKKFQWKKALLVIF
jgi:hypothetical protein